MRKLFMILILLMLMLSILCIITGIYCILTLDACRMSWLILFSGIVGVILSFVLNILRRKRRPVAGIDYL